MDLKTKEKLNSEVGSISGYLRFVSQVLYKLRLGRILGENSRTRPFVFFAFLYVPIKTGNVSLVGRIPLELDGCVVM